MPPRTGIPGVSTDNIIEGSRKRLKVENDQSNQSSPSLGASLSLARRESSSAPAVSDEGGRGAVTEQGFRLLDYIIQRVDLTDQTPLCIPFLALPSRSDYPDYYELIKTPLSLEQVRRRLQARQYSTLEEVRNALETIWRNAKRYNLKGSEIYEKARILHSATRESYVDLVEKNVVAPVSDGAPLASVPPLMEQSAKLAQTEKPNALARLDYDEVPRGPPKVSLRLKQSDDLPYEEDEETVATKPDQSAASPMPSAPATVEENMEVDSVQGRSGLAEDTEMKEATAIASVPSASNIKAAQGSSPAPPGTSAVAADVTAKTEGTPTIDSDGEDGDAVDLTDLPGYDPVTGLVYGKPIDKSSLTLDGKFDRRKRPGPRGKRLKSTLRHLVAELRTAKSKNGDLLCEYFFDLPSKTDFPDYYQVIQEPISLNQIESKAVHNRYVNPHSLVSDLRLMANNAKYYNEEKSEVWNAADALERYTEETVIASLVADGFSLDPEDLRRSALPMAFAAASPIAAHAAAFKRSQGFAAGQAMSHSPEPSSRLRTDAAGVPVAAASTSPVNGMANGIAGSPSPAMATQGLADVGLGFSPQPNARNPSLPQQSPSSAPFYTLNRTGAPLPGQAPPYSQGRPQAPVPGHSSPYGYPFPPLAGRAAPPVGGAMSPPMHAVSPNVQAGAPQSPFQRPPPPPGTPGTPFVHHPSPGGGTPTQQGASPNVQAAASARMPRRLQGEVPPSFYGTARLTLADGRPWRRHSVTPSFCVKTKAAQGDSRNVVLSNDLTRMHSLCIGSGASSGKGSTVIDQGQEVILEFKVRRIMRVVEEGEEEADGANEMDEKAKGPWRVYVRFNGRSIPVQIIPEEEVAKGALENGGLGSATIATPAKKHDAIEVAQGATCRVTLQLLAGTSVFDMTISPSPPDPTLMSIANDVNDPQHGKARALLQTPDKYRIFLHRV